MNQLPESRGAVTVADLVSLTGYALGLWWSAGGPSWAALASIAADELDGPVARARNTTGLQGAALNWGADVALTPLALMRLGKELEQPNLALYTAPLVLAVQARMLSKGLQPAFGSARAAVMIATILVQLQRTSKLPRGNPMKQIGGRRSRRSSR